MYCKIEKYNKNIINGIKIEKQLNAQKSLKL